MEGFLLAFAFGSLWYWAVTVLFCIIFFVSFEKENYVGSGLLFICYVLFLQYIVRMDFIQYILQHPIKTLLYIIGYLVIGILWSFVKWWLFLHKKLTVFQAGKESFFTTRAKNYNLKMKSTANWSEKDLIENKDVLHPNIDYYPQEIRDQWIEHVKNFLPKVKDFKGLISSWIMYWPLSFVWSLINDFIKKFIRAIVTHLQGIYNSISNSVFKNA